MPMETNYIKHYGILGQKWGIRRFQNYDGSYTQAGLKRYRKSLEAYNDINSEYAKAKNDYKNNKSQSNKEKLQRISKNRDEARNRLDKDYNHLKYDKRADKGKNLYAKGKTITDNNALTTGLSTVGSVMLSAGIFNYKTGELTRLINSLGINVSSTAIDNLLGLSGLGMLTVSEAKKIVDREQAKNLRAYYAHTSNY